MFRFEKEQAVFDFNGTKLGGQPGEYPRVLGASIFYNKHETVIDDEKGIINKDLAEVLWNRCQELSDQTGIKHFIQIISESAEAFENYFTWFDSIDNKTAFLMDSSEPAALAHACEYVTEVGLADRAIYNSINGSIQQENIDALKASDVNSAIVLAFNPGDPSVIGREKVLAEGGVAGQEKSMIGIAEECGITRPITGGAYHNMTVSWTWLKRWRKRVLAEQYEGKDLLLEQMSKHHFGGFEGIRQAAWTAPDIGCNLMAATLGADFIMYGPIENCESAMTAMAFIDVVLAEAGHELGLQPQVEDHPLFKLC